jgi:hypothetical protein
VGFIYVLANEFKIWGKIAKAWKLTVKKLTFFPPTHKDSIKKVGI